MAGRAMVGRVAVLLAVVLTGCTPMLQIEPNPERAADGVGYVDFYNDAKDVSCNWTVYQSRSHRDLWGGTYTTHDRVDVHVWLGELAAPAHRLVRVASTPGSQSFRIDGAPLVLEKGRPRSVLGTDVAVLVKAGEVTPVRLNLWAPAYGWIVHRDAVDIQGIDFRTGTPALGKPVTFDQLPPDVQVSIRAKVEVTVPYRRKEEMPYHSKE